MSAPRLSAFFLPLIALSLLSTLCTAEPAPVIDSNPPAYIQVGQSRDLMFAGRNLSQISSVALPAPGGLQVELLKQPQANGNQVTLHVVAASDAEPGDRELRVVGPSAFPTR